MYRLHCGRQHTSRGSCTHRLLILHLLDAQVLQRDDSSRLLVLNKHKQWVGAAHRGQQGQNKATRTHCGVLKVVQTVVREDEPPPLPGFYSSPCGAQSWRQRDSATEQRQTSIEAPGRAADRQTDVWADRQMTAPQDFLHSQSATHPEPTCAHHRPKCAASLKSPLNSSLSK